MNSSLVSNSDLPVAVRPKRDAREDACKGMEYGGHVTGLISDVAADINSIPVLGDIFGIVTGCVSAVSHITKAGMDIAATALDCEDIPFEEIKEIMDKRFNELERKLDKQAAALEEVTKQVSKTLKTVERTREEMNRGFSRVLDEIENNEIKSKIFNINNIAQYFNTEKERVKGLPKEEFVAKLEEKDGILQHLKESRVPKPGTLQTALSEIIHNNYAIPKNANDTKAFQALYALFYGVQTYTAIFGFLIENHAYLADYNYQTGEYEKFNLEVDKIKLVFEDFKSTLVGDSNSFINKVSDIVKTVKNKDFVKNKNIAIFKEISVREYMLDEMKADIKKMTLPVIRDIPSKATISFKKPDYNTPLGEFENGKTVRYAVQYEKDKLYSKMSQWSSPVKITKKASPYVRVPQDRMKRNRLIFRKFNSEQPKLVGVMADRQTEMRDINRELYDAAGDLNKDDGLRMVTMLKEERDADVNTIFELGRSALHAAAQEGNVKVMNYLLSNGFSNKNIKDNKGYTACHVAAESGKENFIRQFVRKGGDCNSFTNGDHMAPIHIATKNGYKAAVQALAKQTGGRRDPYVDVNAGDKSGFTALHIAVGGTRALMLALFRQDLKINSKSKTGLTALHLAAMKDDKTAAETLATVRSLDFNAADNNSMTPLHYAAMLGNDELVKYLITRNGIKINAQAKGNKWSPLHYAIFFKKGDTALELIKARGINITLAADDNVTPLHFAAMTGQKDVASELLKKGANKEQKSKEGYTALHMAAMRSETDVAKLLLDKGANAGAKNNKNKTPLDIATEFGNDAVKDLLKLRSGRFRRDDQIHSISFSELPLKSILSRPPIQPIEFSNKNFFKKDIKSQINGNNYQGFMKLSENMNSFKRIQNSALKAIDFNGMLLLMDVLLKKLTNGKYEPISDVSASDLEVQARALEITDQFEKFFNKFSDSNELDLAEVHSEVYRALKNEDEGVVKRVFCKHFSKIVNQSEEKREEDPAKDSNDVFTNKSLSELYKEFCTGNKAEFLLF